MVETETDRSYGSYQNSSQDHERDDYGSYQKLLSIKTMKGMKCKIQGLASPPATPTGRAAASRARVALW